VNGSRKSLFGIDHQAHISQKKTRPHSNRRTEHREEKATGNFRKAVEYEVVEQGREVNGNEKT
jgi:hypothetical protein